MSIICFLFPGPGNVPCGGLKVIGEYANRLAQDGNQVHIAYAGSLFWRKKNLYFKLTNVVRYAQRIFWGYSCRSWFPLDSRVKEHYVFSLNYHHVPQADIYIASNPYTAMYLKNYPIADSRKFYFIQAYENWGDVTDEKLRETYHYPFQKIVISNWLKRIMDEEQVACTVVPNGFDFNYFHQNIPMEKKERFRVAMLYHKMERKGCKYGLDALNIVKKRYPQLKVSLFGIPARPADLPDWYEYYQSPDRETHNRIYNESAIYLGCSSVEGWGLTVGEAMICGCAIVCTDNPGYLEMVKDGETALVSPVRDAKGLADHIERLFQNDVLRQQIASNGQQSIQKFSWDSSYFNLKRILDLKNE